MAKLNELSPESNGARTPKMAALAYSESQDSVSTIHALVKHQRTEVEAKAAKEAAIAQAIQAGQESLGQYATPHTRQAGETAVAAYIALTEAAAAENTASAEAVNG
jgi:hypothetical protein